MNQLFPKSMIAGCLVLALSSQPAITYATPPSSLKPQAQSTNLNAGLQTSDGVSYYIKENGQKVTNVWYLTGGYNKDGIWQNRNQESIEETYLRWYQAKQKKDNSFTHQEEAIWQTAFAKYNLNQSILGPTNEKQSKTYTFTYDLGSDPAQCKDIWNAFLMKAYRLTNHKATVFATMELSDSILTIHYEYLR